MRMVEAVQTDVPFHSLQFLLPRLFLRELAEDLEASEVGDLRTPAGRQRAMAKRAGATVGRDPRSHAIYVSNPAPRSSSGPPRRSRRSTSG